LISVLQFSVDAHWKPVGDILDLHFYPQPHLYFYDDFGFSASVYTQITDVEQELNGLMTYDRKVLKVDKERIRKVNQGIISMMQEK